MRLKKEFQRLKKEPVEFVDAAPDEANVFEWHYVVHGPPETPYAGGVFHGKLRFPPEYPFQPPAILMLTPSGRFIPNTRLCLSMSDYHPETWNPAWNVSSILQGLLSFMLTDDPTTGAMESDTATKVACAASSLAFNLKNKDFVALFPHLVPNPHAAAAAAATP